jgi:hypothetical protein
MIEATGLLVFFDLRWKMVTPDMRKALCEAVIHWQSENPVVPNDKQAATLWKEFRTLHPAVLIQKSIKKWQAQMYLEPEPEVPEPIKDILDRAVKGDFDVIEAYWRGRAAK